MKQGVIEELRVIMRKLRDPQRGCPWDCEQTFASLVPHMLEESYEVADAIERGDFSELRAELGDLLFQVIFHAQLAEEQGLFDFNDICHGLADKLIRRHPHVFADAHAANSREALAQWEGKKADERAQKAQHSVLDDIPNVLPALMKAEKIQKRCATVGFDWPSWQPVMAKVREELDEVTDEIDHKEVNPQRVAEELGDLLFAVVNLTRHMGYQAETVLQAANRKFVNRFSAMEERVNQQGQGLKALSLAEMDAIWQQVKLAEK